MTRKFTNYTYARTHARLRATHLRKRGSVLVIWSRGAFALIWNDTAARRRRPLSWCIDSGKYLTKEMT